MKYVIKENKIEKLILNYLETYFTDESIDWTYPLEYDEYGNDWEETNILDFYTGDWEGYNDSNFIFRWYDPEYYAGGDYKGLFDKSPILEIREDVFEDLQNMFGNLWEEPFKKWFEDKFRLNVKTLDKGISG